MFYRTSHCRIRHHHHLHRLQSATVAVRSLFNYFVPFGSIPGSATFRPVLNRSTFYDAVNRTVCPHDRPNDVFPYNKNQRSTQTCHCQVSHFWRDTHAFDVYITFSRRRLKSHEFASIADEGNQKLISPFLSSNAAEMRLWPGELTVLLQSPDPVHVAEFEGVGKEK